MKKLILFYFIVLSSCTEEKITIERSFYMGLSIDVSSMRSSDANVSQRFNNAEIMHFSFKPTEPELYDSSDLISKCMLENWLELKSQASTNQKIYLSVSPLELEQGERVIYSEDFDSQELRKEAKRSNSFFRDPKLKQRYLRYCKQLVDFFGPDYFNMGEDVNLLFKTNPKTWPDFLSFHEYIYIQLKSNYPNLCIFSSVTAEPMVDIKHNDIVLQQLVVLQIIDHSDLYALSIRPDCVNAIANSSVKNGFNRLVSVSSKPLALSVSGTSEFEKSNATFEPNSGLNSLLNSCLSKKTIFVVRDTPSRHFESDDISGGNLAATNITWKKYFSLDYKE